MRAAASAEPGTLGWAVEWRPWLWEKALGRTLSALPDWSDLRVCELGSRSGRLAVYLALQGAVVTGYDLDGVDLDPARRLSDSLGVADRVQFRNYRGDTSAVPHTYDVVVTKSVLVAMPPESAVASVRRLVVPGGLYLGTENRELPAAVNWLRRYRALGLRQSHRSDLRNLFHDLRISTTYGLVSSIVARA